MPPAGRGATIDVTVETGAKKTFASALDWPGWSRSGKTEERALGTLIEYADRYARVAARAGETFDPADYDVVERTAGGSGTDFGVPSSITELDRRPLTSDAAEREARLVEAAWSILERV